LVAERFISTNSVQRPVVLMSEEIVDPDDVSCMKVNTTKPITSNEELMLFMHRFNLDWDTVETMPAFEEHCKCLFRKEIDK